MRERFGWMMLGMGVIAWVASAVDGALNGFELTSVFVGVGVGSVFAIGFREGKRSKPRSVKPLRLPPRYMQ